MQRSNVPSAGQGCGALRCVVGSVELGARIRLGVCAVAALHALGQSRPVVRGV